MINAREMLDMTINDSELARACDALLVETLLMVAKPLALQGKRRAQVNLSYIWKQFYGAFDYDEIFDICRIKLEERGYKATINTNKILTIYW
jgi:hypothetical protein